MSDINIDSALPRAVILGIKDDSGALVPYEPEALPINLPLMPVFAQWGPTKQALLVGGGAFNNIYGAASLDHSTKFANHQSEVARLTFAEGNIGLVERLEAPGCDIARFRLSLDLVRADLPEYERELDGSYSRDSDDQLIETGDTIEGYLGRWILEPIGVLAGEYNFAQGQKRTGSLVGIGGATSQIYPIMDFETRFKGSRGDNIGIRLTAPTMESANPLDGDLVERLSAQVYRLWVAERADAQSTSQTIATLDGEQYVPFTLRPGSVDRTVEMEYYSDDILLGKWEETDPNNFSGYGRFGRIHTYQAFVDEVLTAVYAEEVNYDVVNQELADPKYGLNIFGAVNYTGIPYYTLQLQGAIDGGLVFTENTTLYAVGGADGDLSADAYDAAVNSWLTFFGEGDVPYLDRARYPLSSFYDSGFKLDTKYKMVNLFKRPDMCIAVSTQDVTRPLNTPSEDSSVAVALRARLQSHPESDYYGTPACRAVILAHAGELIGSTYKGILPFTLGLARRAARYMGAGDGIMRDGREFDSAPNSVIREFKNHNVVWRSETARNRDWKNGLVYAESFDTRSIFWPAMQTIYDNDTSILNTYMNVVIACNLIRIGDQAWRQYVGNSKLTDIQLVESVDQFIVDRTLGRYDGRVTVTPNSYYTENDRLRGYSYHTDIGMTGRGFKSVETLTVIAQRETTSEE